MAQIHQQNAIRGSFPSLAGLFALLLLAGLASGCGSAVGVIANSAVTLSPSTAQATVGQQLTLAASGGTASADCSWTSSSPAVLTSLGNGIFQARATGDATASAQCAGKTASANVAVRKDSTGPLVITSGGTYSGNWTSSDWHTPAVQIHTSAPVTLKNATVSGPGDLISIPANASGANVTIENVTGTALDPGVSGVQRGNFVVAEGVASLTVKHCTINGARFGVKVLSATPSTLSITQNLGQQLEDRESDGNGGLLTARPDLGHFIMLNGVSAPKGAEIAWNQLVNTIGQSSTEDVINIYKSQGASGAPINVHDNYMEGNSSPAVSEYTGSGLIADGDSAQPETAFVTFARNQVVHTAGSGVEIAAGHDIAVTGNRIVSCGMDTSGTWFAAPFVNAIVVWNDYSVPQFSNISVAGTVGGMLRPASNNAAEVADIWVRTADLDGSDTIGKQSFTDPCLAGGSVNLQAEDAERSFWQNKLAKNNITVGNQPASGQ